MRKRENPATPEYYDISTVSELLKYVRLHGIHTQDIEFINYAADIVGRCPLGELAEHAKADKQTFFFITRFTWPMVQNMEFYFDHVSERYKELKENADRYEEAAEDLKDARQKIADLHQQVEKARNEWNELFKKATDTNHAKRQAETRVTELAEENEALKNEKESLINDLNAATVRAAKAEQETEIIRNMLNSYIEKGHI